MCKKERLATILIILVARLLYILNNFVYTSMKDRRPHFSFHTSQIIVRTQGPRNSMIRRDSHLLEHALHSVLPAMDKAHSGEHHLVVSPAPPPTPIARAVGKKLVTVNDVILSEYLVRSLTVPELSLPESKRLHQEVGLHARPLMRVEFSSTLAGEETASQIINAAARDVGAFQIVGHEISTKEMRSVMEDVKQMFQTGSCDERKRETFKHIRRASETATEGAKFSDELENVFCKMEKVSEVMRLILFKDILPLKNSGQKEEALLCAHKYYHNKNSNNVTSEASGSVESFPAYSLHLQLGGSEFHLQSTEGFKSFKTESAAIIVTIGKGVKDWSTEYKRFPWEPIFISKDDKPSFFLEFKCYPISNEYEQNPVKKFISIPDQLIIALSIILLYKFLSFIASKFTASPI